MRERLRRWLAPPRCIWLAAMLGALLCLPSLRLGFFGDDYHSVLVYRGYEVGSLSRFDLYRFQSGDPARALELMRTGPWPWWADPRMKGAFWRPLPSAAFYVDHALFGENAVGYHVHTLLWYVAAILAVGALLARVLPREEARGTLVAIAVALFAVDDAHAFPAGWIAARYTSMAAVFIALGLLAHWRWREEGWRPGAALGPLACCAGFAAGETGICALAYLLAYEVLAARDRPRSRLLALAPYFACAAVYLVVDRALGYGIAHSGLYIHPLSDPGRFLAAMPENLAVLLASVFADMPVDVAILLRDVVPIFVVVGVASGLLFVTVAIGAFRGADPEALRRVRWLALGGFLALLPNLGAPIGGRLTMASTIGLSATVAFCITRSLALARGASRRWRWKAAAAWLVVVHGVLAAVILPASMIATRGQGERLQRRVMEIPVAPTSHEHIVILSSSDIFLGVFGVEFRMAALDHLPPSWHVISLSLHGHHIERTGARTLEMSVVGGRFLETPFDQVFRDEPMTVGHRVETTAFTVRVLAVEEGKPTRIAIDFNYDLEGPDMALLALGKDGVVRVTPPALGASMDLPAGPSPLEL